MRFLHVDTAGLGGGVIRFASELQVKCCVACAQQPAYSNCCTHSLESWYYRSPHCFGRHSWVPQRSSFFLPDVNPLQRTVGGDGGGSGGGSRRGLWELYPGVSTTGGSLEAGRGCRGVRRARGLEEGSPAHQGYAVRGKRLLLWPLVGADFVWIFSLCVCLRLLSIS